MINIEDIDLSSNIEHVENLFMSQPVEIERGKFYILETDNYYPEDVKVRLLDRLEGRTGARFELLEGGLKIALA